MSDAEKRPLDRVVEELQDRLDSEPDAREQRGLRLALASAEAAVAKFYGAQR